MLLAERDRQQKEGDEAGPDVATARLESPSERTDHSEDLDQTQSGAPLKRTLPVDSPASPVSNNILIATSPHVMNEDSSSRSTRQEDLDANNDTNDMSSRRNLSNLFDSADSDSNYEDSERGSNDDEAGVAHSQTTPASLL
ncbi:hypothetical protein KRP22_009982 [Phytophthora ramorum]|nr:hypothetical protein KRP22_10155 [Phytophthora ramorum]